MHTREPGSARELRALLVYLREQSVPVTVIGNGTNLLVHDEGVRGVVLHLGEAFSEVRREGERLYAGAGVTLAHLATAAKDAGLAPGDRITEADGQRLRDAVRPEHRGLRRAE